MCGTNQRFLLSQLYNSGLALCSYLRTECVHNIQKKEDHTFTITTENFQSPNGKSLSSQCNSRIAHTLPVRIGVQLSNSRGIYKPGKVVWTQGRRFPRAEFPTPELQKNICLSGGSTYCAHGSVPATESLNLASFPVPIRRVFVFHLWKQSMAQELQSQIWLGSFNKLPSTFILCHKPPRLHSHIHSKCQTKQAKYTFPSFFLSGIDYWGWGRGFPIILPFFSTVKFATCKQEGNPSRCLVPKGSRKIGNYEQSKNKIFKY